MLSKINSNKKSAAGFLLCLVALSSFWSVCNAQEYDYEEEDWPFELAAEDCPAAARDLCLEFRDLRDLIPSNTLAYITQRHYQSDKKFRKAMKFLQTSAFNKAIRQIEDSEVFQQLLQPFADAGVDTELLGSITSLLNCLMTSTDYNNNNNEYNYNARSVSVEARSLQSYGMEVFASIPRRKFLDLLAENLGKNTQFAAFYRIVRNSTFQRLAMNALSSSDLVKPLRALSKHYIDVRVLLAEVFELFSWGPSDF